MFMKKRLVILLICFLLGMALSVSVPASARTLAGSAADPLVSQNWVSAYLDQKFSPLEKQVDALRETVYDQLGLQSVDITLRIGSATATVNGAQKKIDPNNSSIAPYINADNRTMVPVRFIAESMGADVSWDAATQRITIELGRDTIVMYVGQKTYTVNGTSKTMDTVPVILKAWDRTAVPVRFISEALGCTVDWAPKNAMTETVTITR